jgi:hypothetical protein
MADEGFIVVLEDLTEGVENGTQNLEGSFKNIGRRLKDNVINAKPPIPTIPSLKSSPPHDDNIL